ncbi:hypothetical protein CEXT_769161 [Caerostris extrusa]|uniref:Uncharacterized protein n=1 Tax=Caerostris extrusa TaxID=172846 RepID=A0AAV4Y7K2_CAEEX|nr:hypothetical protein CEXT_769161 [Caerostris extrusa]
MENQSRQHSHVKILPMMKLWVSICTRIPPKWTAPLSDISASSPREINAFETGTIWCLANCAFNSNEVGPNPVIDVELKVYVT